MALEKSVLTDTVISDLLMKHYGIHFASALKLELGTANCYRVFDGKKYYFLKELQSSFSENDIIREAKLLEFLSLSDIPTTCFYKTIQNEYVIKHENHLICLEEYIEGQAYNYDNLPCHLLPQVARMLGKLHYALRNYFLPIDMSDAWINSFSSQKVIAEYDALIEIAKNKINDKYITQIIEDLECKKQLAVRCERYKKYYNGITYCATHGDYQGCQIIFDEEKVKAIIDFSSASTLPVTWEIMRSYVQSSEYCRSNAKIDIDGFCDYVCEYMKYSKLTKADMISMPYVYLFQLACSKYGYPQYLSTDSPDKDKLLQFAFWRTQMCREVEQMAETISKELLKLL
ncbi:MAG: phosphotransferase [Clostridia bacterium]|nr:phosphotransferase [Clostridia bacterium]